MSERCALHPVADAVGTCVRCGNFYCVACRGRQEHCAHCLADEPLLPWEREPSYPAGWWLTVRALATAPAATIARTGAGAMKQAFTFSLWTGAGCGVAMGVERTVQAVVALHGRVSALETAVSMVPAATLAGVLFFVIHAPVIAGIFHLSARILRGGAGFRVAYWAASYLSIVWVPSLLSLWLGSRPLGFVILMATFGWQALQLSRVARKHYGLGPVAAWIAAAAPFVVAMSCCLSPQLLPSNDGG